MTYLLGNAASILPWAHPVDTPHDLLRLRTVVVTAVGVTLPCIALTAPITDDEYGRTIHFKVPGGFEVMLYQRLYETQ